MVADNHVHTKYSPDGHNEPEEFVLRALKLGLKHIVFTEHADLMYYKPNVAHCDLSDYFSCVRALQKKYEAEIYIGAGLEIGFTEQNKYANAELVKKYKPDYIINSVHQVGDADCYFAEYFENKTPQEAYITYLKAVLASLSAPYRYNAIGHLGYVCRNAPFSLSLYSAAPELIDEILNGIIERGKILELNASVRKLGGATVPPEEILLRYVSLGGKKVCYSSDSHRPDDLCRHFDAVRLSALAAGINSQTVIEHGKELSLEF